MPPGVFNLVNGDGAHTGHALAAHRDVDMVSFTGSTRAGVAVAKAAADTVKRVAQELGGKSANVLSARRRLRACGDARRQPLFQQQRPVVRVSDAHAGTARTARRSRGHRGARRRGDAGGDAVGRSCGPGTGRAPGAVREGAAPDRPRPRGRRAARGRWPGTSRGPDARILRAPDGLRRRRSRA